MRLLLLLFVAICVFDPADAVLGGKVYVFALIFCLALVRAAGGQEQASRKWLVQYIVVFIAIPVLSVLWYFTSDGRQPFDGWLYLKAYVLILLAWVLSVYRIDLVPMLSAVLVLLAVAILAVFAGIMNDPGLYDALRDPGIKSGVFWLDRRSYGDLTMLQVYFVTSPMLVIPVAYFFHRMITTKWKLTYLTLTGMCIAAMITAGTRNNIFAALLLPALLWPIYTKRPFFYVVLSACLVALLLLPFLNQLRTLLDPGETGNSVKLGLLDDYRRILSDPATLIFGRGLGAYEMWTARPYGQFIAVSELTFFEVIRNFGVPAGVIMIGLLLAPVRFLWRGGTENRALAVAYALFLAMSFSNPILFNSIGILILSAMLARRAPPLKSELAFGRLAPSTLTLDFHAGQANESRVSPQ